MYWKPIQRVDPRNPEGAKKWYCCAVNMSTISERELAQQIADMCTVKYPDVLAVLLALQDEIIFALSNGNSVKLGDIGSLRLVANGAGAATPDALDTSYLEKLRLVFTPAPLSEISLADDDVTFTKVGAIPETT